jgi:hypothetical protein
VISGVFQAVLPRIMFQAVLPRIMFQAVMPRIMFQAVLPRIMFQGVLPRIMFQAVLPRIMFPIFKILLQNHYFTGVLWYDMSVVLVQIKLSLCLIKYQDMKACETMEL